MRLIVGTDPADVPVAHAAVIVSGTGGAARARRFGGLPVVARPHALPIRSGAVGEELRADGAFAYLPAPAVASVVAELNRVGADDALIVASAQVEPGPVGTARPIAALDLADLVGAADREPFHDRRCRKDWWRVVWRS